MSKEPANCKQKVGGVQRTRVFFESERRALRVAPMERRSWPFCWTGFGAKHVGIIPRLIVTHWLHGIDSYTHLVDAAFHGHPSALHRFAETGFTCAAALSMVRKSSQ